MNELDWKQPALVGGVMAGILSVIPIVNFANCCFCAWLLVGGAVAAKMLINRAPRPVRSGEGAQIGAVAGLIAAGVYLLVNIPLIIFAVGERVQRALLDRLAVSSGNPDIQELARKTIEALEASVNQTPAQRLVSSLPVLIVVAVLFIGFSTLGGLLGVALFGFTLSYDEFARTLLTAGENNTLPLEIYAMTTNITTPVLYALGTLTTTFSFVVIGSCIAAVVIIQRRRGKRAA